MPNWVINKITFTGDGAKEALLSHLVKDDDGKVSFDFNTVIMMPEDLRIEKSSRSNDGFKLAITKRCPSCKFIGDTNDKMSENDFARWMIEIFGDRLINRKSEFLLEEEECTKLCEKYGGNLDEVLALGEQVISNIAKYGFADWYEWAYANWGCKWNASNTYVSETDVSVCFDTAWTQPYPLVKKLAEMHKNVTILHEFAEEQPAYFCGKNYYVNGNTIEEIDFESGSKEAYEMYFELWGGEDEYYYDVEDETYVRREGE